MNNGYRLTPALILGLCCGILLSSLVTAAPAKRQETQPLPLPSVEALEAEKKAAETDNRLDDTLKPKVLEFYDQAISARQATDTLKAQLDQLKTLIQAAPRRIQDIQTALQNPPAPKVVHPDKLSSEQIEQQFKQEELDWQHRKTQLQQKEEELNQLITHNQPLNEKIATNTQLLQQLNQDLTRTEANKTLQKARMSALAMRKALRMAELNLWQLQLSQQDLLTNLTQAERNQLADQVSRSQQQVDIFRNLAQQRREQNAQAARQQAEQLQQASQLQTELLHRFGLDDVTQYRVELEAVIQQEKGVADNLMNTRTHLDTLKANFERIRQRVELLGATAGINRLLQKYQQNLPSLATFRQTAKERRKTIDQVTDRQLELEETQRNLIDSQTLTQQLPPDQPQITQPVIQNLQAKREALNELQKVYGRFVSQLSALDLAERERLEVATAFSRYLDSQLLWMPSTDWHSWFKVDDLLPALQWLLEPTNLQQGLDALQQIGNDHSLSLALGMMAVLLLQFYRSRLTQRLSHIGQMTRKIRTDSFVLTLRALLLTALLAAPWPLLLIYTGWRLHQLNSDQTYINGLTDSFIYMGLMLLLLNLTRQICCAGGLGEYHLRWPHKTRASLGKELTWLLLSLLPLGLIATFSNADAIPAPVQLLGRYAFLVMIGLCILFFFRFLRQPSILITELAEKHPNRWLIRLHFLWFPLLIATGVALMLAEGVGYHYTVWQLQQQLQLTVWFLFGLWIGKDLLLRWLYVTERRLRFEEVLRRREELRAQHKAAESAADSAPSNPFAEEMPEINYSELSEQAKRLLHASFMFGMILGIWLIWRDWLPSLNLFFQTPLPLETTQTIDGISKTVPLTLADAVLALFIILITILAAKDLPGVLEISLLQHLPLEPGVRYAITTLSQYAIVATGLILTFSTIGIEWSSIQWLVAALSVGLGFGLQEIVANFISGIIVLFERPIRVGDIVTIGNTSGVVTRINIRATTILNWDKRELLVPNKELITGQVLNWTLSSGLNRIVIAVGISYDADVDKALQLMNEAACEGSRVLSDPPPLVSFDGFGENALLLQVRCYLQSLEDRQFTMTEVSKLILQKFQQAGIDMAFPQRDIHLTNKEPLTIRVVSAE